MSEVIHKGYLTKHGAVVKNWKLRFMVLLKNGKLLYFAKPPANHEIDEPKGVLNVQSDVVELIMWEETVAKTLVKWPKATVPKSGFCLKTRQGRLWSLHAESPEACDDWVEAVRTVGANIHNCPRSLSLALKKRDEERQPAAAADDNVTPSDEGQADAADKYVHKVVGGMVVKVENKK